jgi:probable phosphoglycerate mutase
VSSSENPEGPARVVVEADGGSRGNPGPAAYGALLKDAETGELLAEVARPIGTATNNVAEYQGLIAGLELAAEFAPGAVVEARLDSKLVVEQLRGTWQVKKENLKPLKAEAERLAPAGTMYTWIPREENAHADRLANEALDGELDGVRLPGEDTVPDADPTAAAQVDQAGSRGTDHGWGEPTTLVLVRHGVTAQTVAKRFSGGLGGENPPLIEEGRAQIRSTADWLAALGHEATTVIASPVRRTRESAEIIAERLDLPLVEEAGFAEMEFGEWDGLTFGEVARQHEETFTAWLGNTAMPVPGGESFEQVRDRVLVGLERVLTAHAGRTVIVVSHVTPIKTLVGHALDAPLDAGFRMELSPASVSVLSFFTDPDGVWRGAMRLYNATPPE